MYNNIAVGKAVELRVASELLLRGFEVYLTTADSGVDLILGNGKKIQVKGSHQSTFDSRQPRYTFSFKAWHKKTKCYSAHELEGVDFLILWGIEDNIFFIVPAELVRGKYSVRLNPNSERSQSILLPYREKWELLNC